MSKKPTILIIDDSRFFTRIMADHLVLRGCTVLTAETGAEAIMIWRENQIDLVIIDHILPAGVFGYMVLRLLRELNPEVKAIVTTGSEGEVNTKLYPGISLFLFKPLNKEFESFSQMVDAIMNALA